MLGEFVIWQSIRTSRNVARRGRDDDAGFALVAIGLLFIVVIPVLAPFLMFSHTREVTGSAFRGLLSMLSVVAGILGWFLILGPVGLYLWLFGVGLYWAHQRRQFALRNM